MTNNTSRANFLKSRLFKTLIFSVCVLFAVVSLFFLTHIFAGGQIYSIFTKTIDVSGEKNFEPDSISRCKSLNALNISNTGIDDISWILSDDNFKKLETLDISGNNIPADQLALLREHLTNCSVKFTAQIGNTEISNDTTHIKLSGDNTDNCKILLLCDKLQRVDITECENIEPFLNIVKDERCSFVFDFAFGDEIFSSDIKNLSFQSIPTDDFRKLQLLSNLESLEIKDCTPSPELFELRNALPSCDIVWHFDLCGIPVSSKDTEINMNRTKISDTEFFSQQLAYLPSLKKIDMCGCGLSNKQMEVFMEAYPDVKFVWEIRFGHAPVFWKVRTDIECFSTLGKIRCSDEEFEPLLKYCTDLVALDLGHHNIKDISLLANMKNLQVLILGDNLIRDISPLAELKELQYLELFTCKVKDISPLAELPNLIDICIPDNPIEDITPLLSMKQAKMLWIAHCGLNNEEREAISNALPDCTISFFIKDNLCENWRVTDRNIAIRKAFGNWQYVIEYNNWDDVVYQEGVNLKETYAEP